MEIKRKCQYYKDLEQQYMFILAVSFSKTMNKIVNN